MTLTKEQSIDQIEIVENGTIQVRHINRILEKGNVISTSYHRSSFEPGSDLSEQEDRVQAIANAVWTPEVIAAYQAQQEANKLGE